ncbi:hypothetical protein [Streptomyces sp. CRN 30]|uniref:hypothetical protein n=1 Tax=Streptomyces sp. CRN 30 TaxID=3075613 RepID=UPI002A83EE1A|nr:hypothetical protein [Streptomyces sp. CRN 30]
MSRDLQHRLHTRLQLATEMLDLPLTGKHLEDLAVELTPAIKAMLAEQADSHTATVPVRYAVVAGTETDETTGIRTTTYAPCTTRVSTDVAEDAPAALLAATFRTQQADVTATDVPSAAYLGLTVRPQSLQDWAWWVARLALDTAALTQRGGAVHGVGTVGEVVVNVCGDGVPDLLADESVARLMGLLAPTQALREGAGL